MMVPIAWRMIHKEKVRFLITISGVGFAVMLMFFLFGIFEGVKNGATSYVLSTPAEIWMCQKNSTNLLRSSSFMNSSLEFEIQRVNGVGAVSGILRVIATATINDKLVTLFVFGFDPKSKLGTPSDLVQGTSAIGSGEIILDKAFAAKHRLALGDTLQIQDRNFRVSGISEGTNAIVAQFVFVTLEDARHLFGISDIFSFYLLTANEEKHSHLLIDSLKQQFPSLAVFSKQEFVDNNLEEMKTGVLPILWTIALLGVIVGAAVITLMMYGSILEKREDYAVLKAIGASQRYLLFLIIRQSLTGAVAGFTFGLMLDFICAPLLRRLVPEISLLFTWQSAIAVFATSLLIGLAGSLAPAHKLSYIYPAEVFRV